MLDYQKIGMEFLELCRSDPLSIPVWWMLQIHFMLPAHLIARNNQLEEHMKYFTLNGIKTFNSYR